MKEEVLVKNNNIESALRTLKKRMSKAGFFKDLKIKQAYEKPSEKKKRKREESQERKKLRNRRTYR